MKKSRFFAEGEPFKLSESFLVTIVTFLDKTYLGFTYKKSADILLIIHQPIFAPSRSVRPLDQYALSVSTPPEKCVSLIVRRRTNRVSRVCYD